MLNNQRVDFMAGVSNTKLNRIWKSTHIAGWGHLDAPCSSCSPQRKTPKLWRSVVGPWVVAFTLDSVPAMGHHSTDLRGREYHPDSLVLVAREERLVIFKCLQYTKDIAKKQQCFIQQYDTYSTSLQREQIHEAFAFHSKKHNGLTQLWGKKWRWRTDAMGQACWGWQKTNRIMIFHGIYSLFMIAKLGQATPISLGLWNLYL